MDLKHILLILFNLIYSVINLSISNFERLPPPLENLTTTPVIMCNLLSGYRQIVNIMGHRVHCSIVTFLIAVVSFA